MNREELINVITAKELEFKQAGILHLRLPDVDITTLDSVDLFIKTFFHNWNIRYDCYTYNSNNVQVERGCKSRTIGDIYRILLYYYPDITLFDTLATLYRLVETDAIGTWVCYDLNDRIYKTDIYPYDRSIHAPNAFTKPYWFDNQRGENPTHPKIDKLGFMPEDYILLFENVTV